ncbi:MAG: Sir2 family NAD-dependent protein deacetylase, partial [Bacteroidota bacterium]
MISEALREQLIQFYKSKKRLIILTGAGVSAESGIPTFRGPEGYWKVGSRNYMPQEIGTQEMFRREPQEVWKWYLFRRTVCQEARPNPGHEAIATLEKMMGDRLTLITQNVDGLHLRAGNSLDRTYLIHGSLEYVRCSVPCSSKLYPFPQGISPKDRDSDVTEDEWKALACPNCGAMTRPHILWFDEYYNEEYFKFKSSKDLLAKLHHV